MLTFQRRVVALVRRRTLRLRQGARLGLPEPPMDWGLELGRGADTHAEVTLSRPELSSEVQLTRGRAEQVNWVKRAKQALAERRLAWRSRDDRVRATR